VAIHGRDKHEKRHLFDSRSPCAIGQSNPQYSRRTASPTVAPADLGLPSSHGLQGRRGGSSVPASLRPGVRRAGAGKPAQERLARGRPPSNEVAATSGSGQGREIRSKSSCQFAPGVPYIPSPTAPPTAPPEPLQRDSMGGGQRGRNAIQMRPCASGASDEKSADKWMLLLQPAETI